MKETASVTVIDTWAQRIQQGKKGWSAVDLPLFQIERKKK